MSIGDEGVAREPLRSAFELAVVTTQRASGLRQMFEAMDGFERDLAGLLADGLAEETGGLVRLTPAGAAKRCCCSCALASRSSSDIAAASSAEHGCGKHHG
jgi:hypothetical protein